MMMGLKFQQVVLRLAVLRCNSVGHDLAHVVHFVADNLLGMLDLRADNLLGVVQLRADNLLGVVQLRAGNLLGVVHLLADNMLGVFHLLDQGGLRGWGMGEALSQGAELQQSVGSQIP